MNTSPELNVLLVEDSADDAQLIILQLEQEGLKAEFRRVDTEASFIAALEPPPDLILSDFSMPQFNGLLALRIVNERGLEVPFILISGTVGEDIAVDAIKQGADDYLMKDRLARLGPAVRNALNKKRLRDEKANADLALRNSEARYRNIFQTAPVSIWEEDFTEVYAALDELRAQGITDFRVYLGAHPDFVTRALQMVRVLDVNEITLHLYGARDKTELLGSMEKLLVAEEFQDELIAFAEGKGYFEKEVIGYTMQGQLLNLWMTESFFIDTGGHYRALVCFNDITERKQTEQRVDRQLKRLSALHTIDKAINSSFELRTTLEIFLNEVITQLEADAAAVLLFNKETIKLKYTSSRGFHSSTIEHIELGLGEGYAGRAILEQRNIFIPNLRETAGKQEISILLAGENFISYFGLPLIAKGEVVGVLEIFQRSLLDPQGEWLDYLESLAGQAAIAIDNAQLFEDLQRSNFELTLAYEATIEGWSQALDLRDKETEGHTQRVTTMTVKLARQMGIPDAEVVHIRRGALLHDIGKMGVPDNILLKSDKLTEAEWEMMRQHPVLAHKMLTAIGYLKPALDIPYSHHEKWDGTGYPQGLKGEQIPLAARIFAIVDVWDALTSNRPYRDAWSREQALEYIQEQSVKHFDPRVVQAFLIMINKE